MSPFWPGKDVATLRRMAADSTAREIGDALGRSADSVRLVAKRLGVQLKPGQPRRLKPGHVNGRNPDESQAV